MDPQTIISGESTVSGRIRALDRAGYARADIARLLGKRYQHVRNVLEADRMSAKPGREPEQGPGAERSGLGVYRLQVRPDGSIMLPTEVLAALETAGGELLIGELSNSQFVITNWRASALRARELVQSVLGPSVDLAGALISERREEVRQEAKGG